MKIETIEANSAPERVVKQILANIDSGDMRPGDKLPTQEQLAEMFGVGRSSIREATNALAIMGYLEIIQGKGTFVQSSLPSKTDTCSGINTFTANANLFNLFEIREVLECHVVEKAARIASEGQLALLSKAVRNLSECIHEPQNFLSEDLNFHMQLANAAKLPEVAKIIRDIHTIINMKFPVLFTTTQIEKINLAIDTANRVYHYVLSGEVGPATRCMRNHLNIAKEAIRAMLMEEIDR